MILSPNARKERRKKSWGHFDGQAESFKGEERTRRAKMIGCMNCQDRRGGKKEGAE